MKNVFAFERRTERSDGEKFISRRIDREHADKQKRLSEEEAAFERTAGLPVWVNACGLIAFFLGSVLLCGFFDTPEDSSFQDVFARAGWCLIAGITLIVIGGVILTVSHFQTKRARAGAAYAYLKEKRGKVEKESFEVLGVNGTAKPVDVISMLYRRKKNAEPYKEKGFGSIRLNLAVMAFVENNALCFALPDCVYCIPLDWIVHIVRVEKRMSATGWNKGEAPRHRLTGYFLYNGYKIGTDNGGTYSAKPYYRMTVRDEKYEEYYILIPCYDIDAIVSLTGKTVE